MPIIHIPSFNVAHICGEFPELILAAAAIGAVYRFQDETASRLHHSAQLLASVRLDRMTLRTDHDLHYMQTLVLLEIFSLWHNATAVSLVTPSLQNLLLNYTLRRHETPSGEQNWASWVLSEGKARLVIAAFCVLNARSLFHHTSPAVVAYDVQTTLPSTTTLWSSDCAEKWTMNLIREPPSLGFHSAYKSLMSGEAETIATSPFGCFALLQAIIQRIDLCRKMSLSGNVQPPDVMEIE